MRLDLDVARARLEAHDHGVLCTSQPDRGVDAVPVVYAIAGDDLAVPVDVVKPKSSLHLQRERNLESDPRAVLLIDHWDPHDWSRLWWVRVGLRRRDDPGDEAVEALTDGLAGRYPQYAERPFARLLVLEIVAVTGWSAVG